MGSLPESVVRLVLQQLFPSGWRGVLDSVSLMPHERRAFFAKVVKSILPAALVCKEWNEILAEVMWAFVSPNYHALRSPPSSLSSACSDEDEQEETYPPTFDVARIKQYGHFIRFLDNVEMSGRTPASLSALAHFVSLVPQLSAGSIDLSGWLPRAPMPLWVEPVRALAVSGKAAELKTLTVGWNDDIPLTGQLEELEVFTGLECLRLSGPYTDEVTPDWRGALDLVGSLPSLKNLHFDVFTTCAEQVDELLEEKEGGDAWKADLEDVLLYVDDAESLHGLRLLSLFATSLKRLRLHIRCYPDTLDHSSISKVLSGLPALPNLEQVEYHTLFPDNRDESPPDPFLPALLDTVQRTSPMSSVTLGIAGILGSPPRNLDMVLTPSVKSLKLVYDWTPNYDVDKLIKEPLAERGVRSTVEVTHRFEVLKD